MHAALSHAVRARNERGELAVIASSSGGARREPTCSRALATEIAGALHSAGAVAFSVVTSGLFGGSMRHAGRSGRGRPWAAHPPQRLDPQRSRYRGLAASGAFAVLIVFSLVELPQLVDLLQAARERRHRAVR